MKSQRCRRYMKNALTLTPPSESVYGSQFFDAKLLQVTKEVVH